MLWPAEHGRTGWDLSQYYIFDQGAERAGALSSNISGLIYLGPVIYTYGTTALVAGNFGGQHAAVPRILGTQLRLGSSCAA